MSRVFIKTYGCSFNQLDSQIMAINLKKEGHELIENEENADLIVINSCSVKNGSEVKFFNDIARLKKEGKKIIASGCVPQAEVSYLNTKLKDVSTIGTNNLSDISYVAKKTLKGDIAQIVSDTIKKRPNEKERLELEQIRLNKEQKETNEFVEIVPINEGCLNTCSFCKTKQARGILFSYSIESIKEVVKSAVKRGVKEIYLTSQDTACYGFDIGTNLPNLLKELLTIKGDYKIRIGMGNPNHFKKIIDELLDIMISDERVYKFLHIPLQSGNNRILTEMKRMYTLEEFEKIIFKAKLKIPNITIANDLIVAYPTETDEEFEDTIKSLNKVKTNVLNFSRFWLRPKTPAAKMYTSKDFIDGTESKRRVAKLKDTFEQVAINNNKKWLGWEGEVLITEIGKEGTNTFVTRNNYYKPILIKIKPNLKIGDIIKVKITDITWYDFRAEVI